MITIPPEDVIVNVGETATFRCVGSGIPTPTVKWYNEASSLITEGTTLTVENVQAARRNPIYICVVSSGTESVTKNAQLITYGE